MTTFNTVGRLTRGACAVGAVLLFAGSPAIADKGGDHKPQQTPGSFLGVSGSSIEFLNIDGALYCYAGTMGSLIEIGGKRYVLSNNHVLARESSATPAGPDTQAYAVDNDDTDVNVGDEVVQPGLLDVSGDGSCAPVGTDYYPLVAAKLYDWVPLDFSANMTVDAAIAEVVDCDSDGDNVPDTPCFDPDGRILDIGGLSGLTLPADDALLLTPVQKSGRTTGRTTGTVGAIGATVNVGYNNGTVTFVNQIVISGEKGAFLKSGDSGSLAVTRTDLPDAVGLLFAGSRNGIAIANPIDDVLSEFGATMVGCSLSDAECAQTGPAASGGGDDGGGGGKPSFASGLDIAADARDRHSESLMANPDVVGTGLSYDRNGEPVIQVYTKGAARSVGHAIPSSLDGVKVQVIVTGEFKAL